MVDNQAWFAGYVVDTNQADWMGDWGSFKVQDNGQGQSTINPDNTITPDKLWGAFADNQQAALGVVTGHTIPKTGDNESLEYSITSGNLQVH